MEALVGDDLAAESFGASLDLAGVIADACQFSQQLAAFLKTDHGTNGSNHAHRGGRQAGLLDTQMPVAWAESAAAKLAVIVSPFQLEFAQYALKNLYPASGVTSGLAAMAGTRRTRVIGSVGVELLLDSARRQTQDQAARGGFNGFEIDEVRSA